VFNRNINFASYSAFHLLLAIYHKSQDAVLAFLYPLSWTLTPAQAVYVFSIVWLCVSPLVFYMRSVRLTGATDDDDDDDDDAHTSSALAEKRRGGGDDDDND
jgi:hypothetical protein